VTHVYLLYHLHHLPNRNQQVLFVGAFGSRRSALRAITKLRRLPGFRSSPKLRDHRTDRGNGFNINRMRLGECNWAEGF
jgi:hypothetical protein